MYTITVRAGAIDQAHLSGQLQHTMLGFLYPATLFVTYPEENGQTQKIQHMICLDLAFHAHKTAIRQITEVEAGTDSPGLWSRKASSSATSDTLHACTPQLI